VARHRARRRNDGQERARDLRAGRLQRILEQRDVAGDRGVALVGDRRDRDRRAALWQLLGREVLRVEFREQGLVASGAARRVEVALLDAAEPVEHVERPAAQLAELAVADHVYAGFGLLADHLRDLLAQAGVECGLVDRDATLDRIDVAHHLRRADEASHVGRQDSVCGHAWPLENATGGR
jgi:hypothetical protein